MEGWTRPLVTAGLLLVITIAANAATPPPETCGLNADSCGDNAETQSYLSHIPKLKYAPNSEDLFSFKWYNPNTVIRNQPMKNWLRFSAAFWHTMRGDGSDPFGSPTRVWPWEDASLDPITQAKRRLDVFFELLDKLGIEFWTFHDRDIAPEMPTLAETNAALDQVVDHAATLQKKYNIKLLWATAQLFKHPRYANGAATNPNVTVFAYAAAQTKKAMDVTARLGGIGFVLWGGREGYSTLLNTHMRLERDNHAKFIKMAMAYAHKIGWHGSLFIEPKPKEPMTHQYDYDAATTHAFLLSKQLINPHVPIALNIECNHATLAGHSCFHELTYASENSLLGSIDINVGDPQLGWDTDQFLTNPVEATMVALAWMRNADIQGMPTGGMNFDAKLRRESTSIDDLVLAHVAGMDAMARGLRNAAELMNDRTLDLMVEGRYESWRSDLGNRIAQEQIWFEDFEAMILEEGDPADAPGGLPSGQQEVYELIVQRTIV